MNLIDLLIPQAFAQSTTNSNQPESAGGLGGVLQFIWDNFDNWIAGIFIVAIFYILAKAASKSATRYLVNVRGEEVPENALVLVDRLVMIAIISVGLVIAGSINGIQLATVLGAIGLGVGFALKDIIGNMVSSVIMLAQKHVNIGDLVDVAGTTGTIWSIDTRVTVLQSLDGHKVIIPNQQMINEKITSYTSNPFRRLEIFTYISWDSDLEKGMNLVREVINQYDEILKNPEPSVLLDNIEDESNFAIRVLFWIDSNKNWLDIQSNLHHRILKAFAAGGVSIAYPVRSLTISENVHDTLEAMKQIKEGVVPTDITPDLSDAALMRAAKSTKDVIVPQRLKEEVPANVMQNQPAPPSLQPAPVPVNEIPVAPGAKRIDLNPMKY